MCNQKGGSIMVSRTCVGLVALVLVLTFAGGASADLGTLSAWFPMDDNAENTEVNEAVGDVDGTLSVNTDQRHSEDYVFGTGALSFNGSSDRMDVPHDSALSFGADSFTISMYLKTTDSAHNMMFKASGSDISYYIYSSGTTFRFAIKDSVMIMTDLSYGWITTGEWVHVACVRNREYVDPETEESAPRLEIWIDGVLRAFDPDTRGNIDNTQPLTIYTDYCGLIDDLAFYKSALNEEEIEWVRDQGVGVPIPEPGTMILAGFGVLALLLSRRKR
jgi:hypothetical protein